MMGAKARISSRRVEAKCFELGSLKYIEAQQPFSAGSIHSRITDFKTRRDFPLDNYRGHPTSVTTERTQRDEIWHR